MKKKKISIIFTTLLSTSMLSGCGLTDVTSSNNLNNAVTAVQIGVAAKALYEIAISFQSEEVANEKSVVKKYLQKNDKLPKKSTVVKYTSSIPTGNIVQPGVATTVESNLTVVPGEKAKSVSIQEKIEIFDNDDNTKVIKSLVKTVNKKNKGGNFSNRFSFTLPSNMPQGVYPIKTSAIVDGEAQNTVNRKMQVALHVLPSNAYQFIALAD